MKRKDFEKELAVRLRENKQLAGKKFIPQKLNPLASLVMNNLFWIYLVSSWALTLLTVMGLRTEVNVLSRRMLGL